jgi:hypothetical protein
MDKSDREIINDAMGEYYFRRFLVNELLPLLLEERNEEVSEVTIITEDKNGNVIGRRKKEIRKVTVDIINDHFLPKSRVYSEDQRERAKHRYSHFILVVKYDLDTGKPRYHTDSSYTYTYLSPIKFFGGYRQTTNPIYTLRDGIHVGLSSRNILEPTHIKLLGNRVPAIESSEINNEMTAFVRLDVDQLIEIAQNQQNRLYVEMARSRRNDVDDRNLWMDMPDRVSDSVLEFL